MAYDEKTKEILGKNIWRRREVLGISREELEDKMGVSRTIVGKWERGVHTPSRDKIKLLSKVLKCSINELFSEQRMAVLNHTSGEVVEEVKEDIREPIEDITEETIEPVNDDIVRVSDKLNECMSKHNLTGYEMAKQSGVSNGTLWRIKNKKTNTYSEPVKQLEKWLDEVDKVEEPKQEPVKDDVVKGSISDRLNIIYDTLFNSLAELDELKQDIAKIEKVTTLLKQIDL